MYSQISSNKRKSVFLVTIFIAIILLLGWTLDQYYDGQGAGIVMAIIFSFFSTLISYFAGDKIALSISGAEAITKEQNPYLYRLVENLCITAGLSLPKIYLIPDASLNAFATGRDPAHASIAVTQGLLDRLENEELEGVIAHELSHIKNYDVRFMMLVAVLVGSIALLAYWFRHSMLWGGRPASRERRGGGGGNILLLIGVILAILAPLLAELIKLAVSRKREFLADASGALLTRYPEGLARALEKIAHAPVQKLATANHATASLYIANPFGAGLGKKFAGLFSTHPPIEERVKILRGMERQP